MQNSYVHNAGQWHLVNGTYAHHNGQWHLVQNAYVHHNGQWHLAQSAGSNLDQIYDTPGDFTYKVPDGVYNIEFTYPTPTGLSTFKINNVTPGQEIPVTIGEYGTTSSVCVSSSSTYILPAFDVPVLSLVTSIGGWLYLTVSAATPSGQSATVTDIDNPAASAAATAAGAIFEIGFEDYPGSSTMSLTPVKTEYITNWPRARILQTAWGGRNNIRTLGELTPIDGYYTYKFSQNDDPQRGYGSYTYGYNLQQILRLVVKPANTSTSAGGLIISPSSFSTTAIVGTTYTQQFNASGGTAPYSWRSSVGAISTSGFLTISSGTLAAAGTLAVTVTATSANSLTGTITPILNISGGDGTGGGGVLSISPTSLPGGTVGVAYSQTVTVSGGVAPYNWDVASATTVDGISISASGATLTVTGTPTVDGSVTIPYTITDSSIGGSLSISGSLGFIIAAAAVVTESVTISVGFVTSPATSYPIPFTPSVTYTKTGGGSGTLVWQLSDGSHVYNGSQSITSGSPASLSINAATGTNYTLTASVGSVSATPATGIPIG